MEVLPLTVARKHVTQTAYLFSLSGELTAADAYMIERQLVEALAAGGRELVVDVSDVLVAEAGALVRLLQSAERLSELGAEVLLATRDPWGDDYVLAPLERGILERATAVIPSLARASAA